MRVTVAARPITNRPLDTRMSGCWCPDSHSLHTEATKKPTHTTTVRQPGMTEPILHPADGGERLDYPAAFSFADATCGTTVPRRSSVFVALAT